MNDRICELKSWPGTSTGKPGGYGVTKVADTTCSPASARRCTSSGIRYSQLLSS